MGHVTPVNWPVPMNRGPQWSPKKLSWSSSSPRRHLELTRRPEPSQSAGHREEGTPVSARSREDGSHEAPSCFHAHAPFSA